MPFPTDIPPIGRREILRRAAIHRRETQLVVDFYRIRQRLFFPLPVEEFPENLSTVRGLPNYPYAIWLLWKLEDRIFTMGWAAEWDGQTTAVQRDLEALTGWTRFRQTAIPDLCSAHITKILISSLAWRWLPPALRKRIHTTLRRLVDDGFPRLPELPTDSVRELIKRDIRFPNIPTIGAMGLAMAAAQVRHARTRQTAARANLMAELWLQWGEQGHVEGISYDGYTCDFLMEWLSLCPAPLRWKFLSHPRLKNILQEIRYLGTPGRPENLALLGDVEPAEMRFHYSFAAKYLFHRGSQEEFPFPSRPEKFLRADALPFLSPGQTGLVLSAGVHDAQYALVLQSTRPVKVAVSWSNSRMGHMQPDHGSLVLGAGEEWLLDDPGYRQYLPTSEKNFTLGTCAHNHPVINGEAPSQAPGDRTYEMLKTPSGAGIRLNLTPTFAQWKGTCVREIRLDNQGRLTVDDHFQAAPIRRIDYHWHGHPSGAWHLAEGWGFLLGGKNSLLSFTCDDHPLHPEDLQRLPGSRGHLSVVKTLRFAKPRKTLRIRWLFEMTSTRPPSPSTANGSWSSSPFFTSPGSWTTGRPTVANP